jgi:micrococcal nuclease
MLMNILKVSLLALLLATQSVSAADQIAGKVVKVSDGDTVTLLLNGTETIKVRLSEIDAPETNQPWGNNSKQALSLLIATKNVTVSTTGKDRYGRTLGTIYLQEENINKLMVQNGNAWAYTKYVADQEYFLLQDHAKTQKVGLWSLSADQITAPWEWRQKSK